LRKLLTEDIYHRVYVFWDGKFSGKLRYELYSPYKSSRGKDYLNGTQPVDEDEVRQKAMVRQYMEELSIRQLMHPIIEADDFIAYCCLMRKPYEKITICSNDRDMCQLIEENVRIYFCDLKNYVGTSNYFEYFSHHNSNSVLIKTITGDNSDSIKGIKGVKEQTLLSLFPELKEHRLTIDDILTKAKELQDNRIKENKKPLQKLTNIIESVTDGVQGKKIYEINSRLVDLKRPLLTEDGIAEISLLMEGEMGIDDRSLKNVMTLMKKDGLEHMIGANRYPEFLLPFKKLTEREKTYEQEN
jgi:5'-3' exonuclease